MERIPRFTLFLTCGNYRRIAYIASIYKHILTVAYNASSVER
jgi:hypothetical protein